MGDRRAVGEKTRIREACSQARSLARFSFCVLERKNERHPAERRGHSTTFVKWHYTDSLSEDMVVVANGAIS